MAPKRLARVGRRFGCVKSCGAQIRLSELSYNATSVALIYSLPNRRRPHRATSPQITNMKLSKTLHFALALALVLPLAALVARAQQPSREIVVTQANNGATVTLKVGETLVVRLPENSSTGYSRALVTFPNMPIYPVSQQTLAPAPAAGVPAIGAPKIAEWKFEVDEESTVGRTVWLKFLTLRPFAKGVETAGLWEVKVVVPATPVE